MTRKPFNLILVPALFLALVGCSDTGGAVTVPSSLPTAIPTASVGPAVCDAKGRVFDVVGRVQTGAVESKADVASSLRGLARQLDSEAQRLRAQGLTTAADSVRALSAATTQLADAVEGADTAAIVSAAARAASAIEAIPGCPSPSPSPSA
jgi:hypothetical protein